MLKKLICLFGSGLFFFLILLSANGLSQQGIEREQNFRYENGNLMIKVYIWGEVIRPGEYEVPEGADILELISKADGPTRSANLSKVKITRRLNVPNNNEKLENYERLI